MKTLLYVYLLVTVIIVVALLIGYLIYTGGQVGA